MNVRINSLCSTQADSNSGWLHEKRSLPMSAGHGRVYESLEIQAAIGV